MVRVGLGLPQRVKQRSQLLMSVTGQTDGEVQPAERRQKLEPGDSEVADPRQVDDPVGDGTPKQAVERSLSDVVECAEDRDTPERCTIEEVGVVRPPGVL